MKTKSEKFYLKATGVKNAQNETESGLNDCKKCCRSMKGLEK